MGLCFLGTVLYWEYLLLTVQCTDYSKGGFVQRPTRRWDLSAENYSLSPVGRASRRVGAVARALR